MIKQPQSYSEPLIEAFMHGSIMHAPVLLFKRKEFCPDMVLLTSRGNVRIIAEGFDLASGEEVFYLNLDTFDESNYWVDKVGNSAWPPRFQDENGWNATDFVNNIKQAGLTSLLGSDRKVHLYREPSAESATGESILNFAKAVKLSDVNDDYHIVIYATSEFPCSLEIAIDTFRIEEILHDLVEFTL